MLQLGHELRRPRNEVWLCPHPQEQAHALNSTPGVLCKHQRREGVLQLGHELRRPRRQVRAGVLDSLEPLLPPHEFQELLHPVWRASGGGRAWRRRTE
eukprot:163524-Chlamydomonas_euryale.AAC.1